MLQEKMMIVTSFDADCAGIGLLYQPKMMNMELASVAIVNVCDYSTLLARAHTGSYTSS